MEGLYSGLCRWLNRNHARSNAGLVDNRARVALVNGKQDEAIGKSMPDIPDFLVGMLMVLAPSALFLGLQNESSSSIAWRSVSAMQWAWQAADHCPQATSLSATNMNSSISSSFSLFDHPVE
jgi:hypothetical protein